MECSISKRIRRIASLVVEFTGSLTTELTNDEDDKNEMIQHHKDVKVNDNNVQYVDRGQFDEN